MSNLDSSSEYNNAGTSNIVPDLGAFIKGSVTSASNTATNATNSFYNQSQPKTATTNYYGGAQAPSTTVETPSAEWTPPKSVNGPYVPPVTVPDIYSAPAPKPKVEPLSADYLPGGKSAFLPTDTDPKSPLPKWVAATEQTRQRNWPEWMGGGSYALDQSQPGKLVKSDRLLADTPGFRDEKFGGLSGQFFEIDHKIPLWAGGLDIESNMELLDIPTHEKKTAIQSVPLTLMANGILMNPDGSYRKVDQSDPAMAAELLKQAKLLAYTWNDGYKDATGLKPNSSGYVSVDQAIAAAKRWQKTIANPEPVNFTNIKKAFTQNMRDFLKDPNQGTENDYWGSPRDTIRELGKGLASSIGTPGSENTSKGIIPEVMHETGNILGMVTMFPILLKGLSFLGKGFTTVPKVATMSEKIKTGLTGLSKAVETIPKIGAPLSKMIKPVMSAESIVAEQMKNAITISTKPGLLKSVGGEAGLIKQTLQNIIKEVGVAHPEFAAALKTIKLTGIKQLPTLNAAIGKAIETAGLHKTAIQIGTIASKIGLKLDPGKLDKGALYWKKAAPILQDMAEQAGVMATYGQLTSSFWGAVQVDPEVKDTFDKHVQQFWSDVKMGAAAGFFPRSAPGVIGMGTAVASMALMEGASYQDALKSGAIMAGLHASGAMGRTEIDPLTGKKVYIQDVRRKTLPEIAEAEAFKRATSVFDQYLSDLRLVRPIVKGGAVPGTYTFDFNYMGDILTQLKASRPNDTRIQKLNTPTNNVEAVEMLTQVSLSRLGEIVTKSKVAVPQEEVMAEANRIMAAGSRFYSQSLTPEARAQKSIEDFQSLAKQMEPQIRSKYYTQDAETLNQIYRGGEMKFPEVTEIIPDFAELPEGKTIGSASTNQYDAVAQANLERLNAMGIKPDRVVVSLPDQETINYFKLLNLESQLNMTGSEGKPLITNPADALRIGAYVNGEYLPLGYVATPERILNSKFGQNTNYTAYEKRILDIIKRAKTPEELLERLNADPSKPTFTPEEAKTIFETRDSITQITDSKQLKDVLLNSARTQYPMFKVDAESVSNIPIAEMMRTLGVEDLPVGYQIVRSTTAETTTGLGKNTQQLRVVLDVTRQNWNEGVALAEGRVVAPEIVPGTEGLQAAIRQFQTSEAVKKAETPVPTTTETQANKPATVTYGRERKIFGDFRNSMGTKKYIIDELVRNSTLTKTEARSIISKAEGIDYLESKSSLTPKEAVRLERLTSEVKTFLENKWKNVLVKAGIVPPIKTVAGETPGTTTRQPFVAENDQGMNAILNDFKKRLPPVDKTQPLPEGFVDAKQLYISEFKPGSPIAWKTFDRFGNSTTKESIIKSLSDKTGVCEVITGEKFFLQGADKLSPYSSLDKRIATGSADTGVPADSAIAGTATADTAIPGSATADTAIAGSAEKPTVTTPEKPIVPETPITTQTEKPIVSPEQQRLFEEERVATADKERPVDEISGVDLFAPVDNSSKTPEEQIRLLKPHDAIENNGDGQNKFLASVADVTLNTLDPKSDRAKEIVAFKEKQLDSKKLIQLAKDISYKNGRRTGDDASREEYKESIIKMFEDAGLQNPIQSEAVDTYLGRKFAKDAYSRDRNIITFDRNGKTVMKVGAPKEDSRTTDELDFVNKELKLTGTGKEIKIVHFERPPRQTAKKAVQIKVKDVEQAFHENGIVMMGVSGNNEKNIFGLTFSPELAGGKDKVITSKADVNKFIQNFYHEVMKFKPDTSVRTFAGKRSKIFLSEQAQNPVKGVTIRNLIFKSPTLGELGIVKLNDPRYEKLASEIAKNGAFGKSAYDGKIYITEEYAAEIRKAGGYVGDPTRFKPTMTEITKDGIALQKGDISIMDDYHRGIFEQMKGSPIEKYETVTFGDNLKEGNQMVRESENGRYGVLETPSEAWRFSYSNPHEAGGRVSFGSLLAKFTSADQLNKIMYDLYAPRMDRWIDFNNKLNSYRTAEERKAIIKEFPEYGIQNFEIEAFDVLDAKIKNGADKLSIGFNLEKLLLKALQDHTLGGRFIKSDYLTLAPDFKAKLDPKTGERSYLEPNEIMISLERFENMFGKDAIYDLMKGKEFNVLTVRYPITRKTAMSKAKILIAEHHGIRNLGNEQVIPSLYDTFVRKEGDYDADAYSLFKLSSTGEKDAIPMELADRLEKLRADEGDMLIDPLNKYESVFLNEQNGVDEIRKVVEDSVLGGHAIEVTNAVNRLMPMLMDAKTHFVVKPAIWKELGVSKKTKSPYSAVVRPVEIYFNNKLYKTAYIRGAGNNEVIVRPHYNAADVKEMSSIIQESLDSLNTSNLATRMKNSPYDDIAKLITDKLFDFQLSKNTEGTQIVKSIDDLTAISDTLKQEFQTAFEIAKKENPIESTIKLSEDIKKVSDMYKAIKESGGETNLVHDILSRLDGLNPFDYGKKNKPYQWRMDETGVKAVIAKFGKPDDTVFVHPKENFKKHFEEIGEDGNVIKNNYNNTVNDFRRWFMSKKEEYEKFNKLNDGEAKKEIRSEIVEKYNEIKPELTYEENKNLVLWITTDLDANLSLSSKFKVENSRNREGYVLRMEGIMNKDPDLAEIVQEYYKARTNYDFSKDDFSIKTTRGPEAAQQAPYMQRRNAIIEGLSGESKTAFNKLRDQIIAFGKSDLPQEVKNTEIVKLTQEANKIIDEAGSATDAELATPKEQSGAIPEISTEEPTLTQDATTKVTKAIKNKKVKDAIKKKKDLPPPF